MPQKKTASVTLAILTLVALLFVASPSQAQSQEEDAAFHVGSLLLNILHVPYKLATCVTSQVAGAAFYVGTYGVEGSYFGGTNGREIGENAAGGCRGQWIIRTEDVKRDYQ